MCAVIQYTQLVNVSYTCLLYRYWWNTRIFPFTKTSYLHRGRWTYYFYLSRVRILVSTWLQTWLANYKRASLSGARRVSFGISFKNGFEVRRRYSYRWLSRWAKNPQHNAILRYAFAVIDFFLFFIRIVTFNWNRKYKYYCLYFSFVTLYPSFITFLWQAFCDMWPL